MNTKGQSTIVPGIPTEKQSLLPDGVFTIPLTDKNNLSFATRAGETFVRSTCSDDPQSVAMTLRITIDGATKTYSYENPASRFAQKTRILGENKYVYCQGIFDIPNDNGKSTLYSLVGTWWPTETPTEYIADYARRLHGPEFNGRVEYDDQTKHISGLTLGLDGPSTNKFSFKDVDCLIDRQFRVILEGQTARSVRSIEQAYDEKMNYVFESVDKEEPYRELQELRSGRMVKVLESLLHSRLGLGKASDNHTAEQHSHD